MRICCGSTESFPLLTNHSRSLINRSKLNPRIPPSWKSLSAMWRPSKSSQIRGSPTMAFAGVSLIVDGKCCESDLLAVETEADSGYHLLVVESFIELEYTDCVRSRGFIVGGHIWCLEFNPRNYKEQDFMSVCLVLDQSVSVDARFVFSFIDQPELRESMRNRRRQKFAGHQRYGFKLFANVDVLERSTHMLYGSFTIRCDVAVVKKTKEQSVGTIQGHFGNLLLNKEGSDITFEVGGVKFATHRCVLAARSAVFKAQLFGATDEGATAPSVVQISGIKANVFGRLLTFIYTCAMPDFKMVNFEVDEAEDVEGETAWLLELLEAAEKFGLQGLKSICEEILASRCIRETTVQYILGVAQRTRCSWLKEECMEFTESET